MPGSSGSLGCGLRTVEKHTTARTEVRILEAKHYDTWLHKLITSTVRITNRSIFKEAVSTSAMGHEETSRPLLWNDDQWIALDAAIFLLSRSYFSRSQTILRKSVLPGNTMLGPGADSMKSLSPSILKWRLCSVPFHASFQERSTTVMKSSPSTRYFPVYASIDLCRAAARHRPFRLYVRQR